MFEKGMLVEPGKRVVDEVKEITREMNYLSNSLDILDSLFHDIQNVLEPVLSTANPKEASDVKQQEGLKTILGGGIKEKRERVEVLCEKARYLIERIEL